jgi:hypothetical protein
MNDLKYWFNGLPFVGVQNTQADTGTLKFWFNGLPAEALFAAESQSDAPTMLAGFGRRKMVRVFRGAA